MRRSRHKNCNEINGRKVRTLVLEPQQQSQNKQRACNDLDVACNGATHPQTAKAQPNGLQQARHSIPRNGIYHRLTFENPAGHRKSQRRVTNMRCSIAEESAAVPCCGACCAIAENPIPQMTSTNRNFLSIPLLLMHRLPQTFDSISTADSTRFHVRLSMGARLR